MGRRAEGGSVPRALHRGSAGRGPWRTLSGHPARPAHQVVRLGEKTRHRCSPRALSHAQRPSCEPAPGAQWRSVGSLAGGQPNRNTKALPGAASFSGRGVPVPALAGVSHARRIAADALREWNETLIEETESLSAAALPRQHAAASSPEQKRAAGPEGLRSGALALKSVQKGSRPSPPTRTAGAKRGRRAGPARAAGRSRPLPAAAGDGIVRRTTARICGKGGPSFSFIYIIRINLISHPHKPYILSV